MPGISISVSLIFIIVNVVIYFATASNVHLVEQYLFNIYRVRKKKEYYRLISSGFLHGGIMHLLFNCLTLYFFGPYLEQQIGPFLFAVVFLASIVAGNLYCMIMRSRFGSYSALGASGGVMGVIFAFIALNPFAGLSLFILPIAVPAWLFGILFTGISILLTQLPKGDLANISHEGHLGGGLCGAAIMMVAGLAPLEIVHVTYFYLFAAGPIALMAILQILFPSLLYRHKRKAE